MIRLETVIYVMVLNFGFLTSLFSVCKSEIHIHFYIQCAFGFSFIIPGELMIQLLNLQ